MLGLTALAKAAGEILVCYKEPLWIQGHLAENPAQEPGAGHGAILQSISRKGCAQIFAASLVITNAAMNCPPCISPAAPPYL